MLGIFMMIFSTRRSARHTVIMPSLLDNLNAAQLSAVTSTDGPLLILASAGSGKTKTLTHRIAHVIETGLAQPDEILALTFTNKAAGEMRQRLQHLIGSAAREASVMTFHALCLQIARQSGTAIDLPASFSVADPEDSRRLIQTIMSSMATRKVKVSEVRSVAARISAEKNQLGSISTLKSSGLRDDFFIGLVWERYERELQKSVLLDFDNLLKAASRILSTAQGETEWSNRFRFAHIDEFQDSNTLQINLLRQLMPNRNLCVVGDPGQSIYAFRSAQIEHILNFEHDWQAQVVRLTTNYRSSGHIIEAANAVLAHNTTGIDLQVQAALPPGPPVRLIQAQTPSHEAHLVVDRIAQLRDRGVPLSDIAIIYRTNAQARPFEELLRRRQLAFRIVGGEPFYQRPEIKAARSWLSLIANSADNLAFSQAATSPKRGIGPATIATLESWSAAQRMTLLRAARYSDQIPGIKPHQAQSLQAFAETIERLAEHLHKPLTEPLNKPLNKPLAEQPFTSLEAMVRTTLQVSGLLDFYAVTTDAGAEAARANLDILIEQTGRWATQPISVGLHQMLESLKMERPDHGGDQDSITLITFHSTKGLEFPFCFLVGLHDQAFVRDEASEVEEARRLFYVGMTRAIRGLWLSYSDTLARGIDRLPAKRLRFLDELPASVVPVTDHYEQPAARLRQPRRAENSRLATISS
jgi:DNA helicase-2/ATP-dependent DNA helicase PcrA